MKGYGTVLQHFYYIDYAIFIICNKLRYLDLNGLKGFFGIVSISSVTKISYLYESIV